MVAIALLAVTWAALLARCRGDEVKRFWLPEKMPWPTVAVSLARSEFGALVWVAVPGLILTREGDLTYLSWAAGALIARWVVNRWMVDAIFERRERGPLAIIDECFPEGIGRGVRGILLVFVILGTAVTGFLSLAPFATLLPESFPFLLIGVMALAALWTMAGGVRSVVWADVLCVILMTAGLAWILVREGSPLRDDLPFAWQDLENATQFDGSVVDKLRIFDPAFSPVWRFSFWAAVLAVPFAQIVTLGVDPRQTIRWLACGNVRTAKRAIAASFLGQVFILAFLALGCLLFLEYRENPPTDPFILKALDWKAGLPLRGDLALPIWILTELPAGIRGVLLGSLLLLAISQFTPALLASAAVMPKEKSLRQVRVRTGIAALGFVVLLLSGESILTSANAKDPVALTLLIPDLFVAPLLGIFACAVSRRPLRIPGLVVAVVLCLICAGWVSTEAFQNKPPFVGGHWLWPLGTLLIFWSGTRVTVPRT